MDRDERFVRISREEFSLLVRDVQSARHEIEVLRRSVADAKTRHVDTYSGACMLIGLLVPVLMDWRWYWGAAFFFGCVLFAVRWGHLFTGIRDKDTEWHPDRVYERNEWYDWAPQDKPPGC